MKHKSKKTRAPTRSSTSPHVPGSGQPTAAAVAWRRSNDDLEPRAERRWTPLWLILLFAVLFYWGQLYLDSNAAAFDARVYGPFHSYAQLDALQPKDETALLLARGKVLFEAKCGICHDNTGLGKPGQFPPLAGSEWVNTPGPGRILRIALHGVAGPIEVKGQTWNFAMPSGIAGDLKTEELAALVSYVRRSWGNTGSLVKPEQAKSVMDKVSGRALVPWTATELNAVPPGE